MMNLTPCSFYNISIYPSYFKLQVRWYYSAVPGPRPFGAAASCVQICSRQICLCSPQSLTGVSSRGLMRDSCLSPEASLWLDKFVPDEFVTTSPPSYNSNYFGYSGCYNTSVCFLAYCCSGRKFTDFCFSQRSPKESITINTNPVPLNKYSE